MSACTLKVGSCFPLPLCFPALKKAKKKQPRPQYNFPFKFKMRRQTALFRISPYTRFTLRVRLLLRQKTASLNYIHTTSPRCLDYICFYELTGSIWAEHPISCIRYVVLGIAMASADAGSSLQSGLV
jgi:hypothetical protein